ncbi:MAG: Holliday junction resolvase RuvX [Deltaproteobacteria bacterium]|nr:Holliday junction resolvase RuvX [Deltaproteobacteria bacterium]
MARAMGLDVGDKTVGLALSDALGITAQGLPTVQRKSLEADLDAIMAICRENDVERLVVGLPLNMDGSEGPRAEICRRFGDRLSERSGLPVEYWDERLTTAQAERVLLEADLSRRKRKKVIDRLAAQVILQAWMDARCARTFSTDEDP